MSDEPERVLEEIVKRDGHWILANDRDRGVYPNFTGDVRQIVRRGILDAHFRERVINQALGNAVYYSVGATITSQDDGCPVSATAVVYAKKAKWLFRFLERLHY